MDLSRFNLFFFFLDLLLIHYLSLWHMGLGGGGRECDGWLSQSLGAVFSLN